MDRHVKRRAPTAVLVMLLLAVLVLTRWWSHSGLLLDADAVNYVHALTMFDLSQSAPHPPGYVLFVLLGRLVHHWVSDPNTSYLVVNVLMQAVTLVVTVAVIRQILGDLGALLTAGVVLFHPLFWYYGSITSIYTADAAVLLLVAWAILFHRSHPTTGRIFLLGFVWGVVGGVREFTALLATPAVGWHLWRMRRHVAWVSIISGAVVGVILWFAPLMYLCGGWSRYRAASHDVFDFYLRTRAPLFSHSAAGVFYNIICWCTAVFQLIWPLLPLIIITIVLSRRRGAGPATSSADPDRALWITLIAPAAAFYLLIHCGQMGYMLAFLVPVLAILAGACQNRRTAQSSPPMLRWTLTATAALEFCWFVFCSPPAKKYTSAPPPDFYLQVHNWPTVAAKVYKYQSDFTFGGLRKWDAIIRGYLRAIGGFPADSTLLVYSYEREMAVNVFGYYSAPYPLVRRHWQSQKWTCETGGCGGVALSFRDSLTVLELPPRISTVLVIDDQDISSKRVPDRVLGQWGKGPIAVSRPETRPIEDLRLDWR